MAGKPSAAELKDYAEQADAWFKENTVRDPGFMLPLTFMEVSTDQQFDFLRDWQRKVYEAGYLGASWPKEYGGGGLHSEFQRAATRAMKKYDAPIMLNAIGNGWAGPLILDLGSEEQKQKYIKPMLSAEDIWCQGFSEPQAGSDLSALSLSAQRDGDDFVLTGSKLWTSFAQYATHMFLLARIDPASRGGEGLVFLLVEMNRPGIDVRPIRFIDGEYETNEVFFDKVRTPVSDRVGGIGEGWKTAKRLMSIARSNNTTTGVLRRALRAARREAAEAGLLEHANLSDMERRIDDFEAFESRVAAGTVAIDPAPATSSLKLLATELHQAITEIGLIAAPHSAFAQAKYLATRSATIYSGTSEIHRNILARAIGCP